MTPDETALLKPAPAKNAEFDFAELDPLDAVLLTSIDGSTTVSELAKLVNSTVEVVSEKLSKFISKGFVICPGLKPAPGKQPAAPSQIPPRPAAPAPGRTPPAPQENVPSAQAAQARAAQEKPAPTAQARPEAAQARPQQVPLARPRVKQLPLSGTFKEYPFHVVLGAVFETEKTGILEVWFEKKKKKIFLIGGIPVYATSNLTSECLGNLLAKAGKILEDEARKSHTDAKASGRLQGQVLVEMGCLTRWELDAALKWQVEVKIAEIFRWPDGGFKLEERKTLGNIIRLDVNPTEIIFNALRKYTILDNVEVALAGIEHLVPVFVEGTKYDLSEIKFASGERKLLASVREKRRLRDIYRVSTIGRANTGKIIYVLQQMGLLKLIQAEAELEKAKYTTRALTMFLEWFKSVNYFEGLTVHPVCTEKEIEKEFKKSLEPYLEKNIPDIEEQSKEVLDLCATIRQKMEEGYRTLMDKKSRMEYRVKVFDEERLKVFAELQARKGEVALFWKQDADAACDLYNSACELQPHDPILLAHFGLAIFRKYSKSDRRLAAQGVETVKRAIAIGPRFALTYVCMGLVLKDQGNMDGMRQQMDRALQVEPGNEGVRSFIAELLKTAQAETT